MRQIKAVLILQLFFFVNMYSQKTIKLYDDISPGSEKWTWNENTVIVDPKLNQRITYNVVEPTLTVYQANPEKANGTSLIIAPGGGFYILVIDKEGFDAAKWLADKGITCFILKYRLGHSLTQEPWKELTDLMNKKDVNFDSLVTPIKEMAMQDGLTAVSYVRSHAEEYNLDPNKIGFMGFSAGGNVTMSVVKNSNEENIPNFIAPIYTGGMPIDGLIPKQKVPAFVACANDDQLGLTGGSIKIYEEWTAAKQPVELHVFEKGGHGFGMLKQNLPSDIWIDLFYNWMINNGF